MSASAGRHSQGKKRRLSDSVSEDVSTTETRSSSRAELIRDEHVWFEDGNIIIRAGHGYMGDGSVYGFRCHASVLASRSPVFKTMLELPNASGEKLDGAFCVDFPDQWEDVKGLLRFLYGFT